MLTLRNKPRTVKLPPEWAEKARKELGEDPESVPQQLDELRDRLQGFGQKDACPMDDAFYLAFLRARKFNVEKTVKLIRRYREMRRRYPDICRFAPVSQNRRFHDSRAVSVLQDRNYLDAIIIIAKIEYFELDHITPMYVVSQYYTLLEACVLDPLTQVAGAHIVLDLAGITFRHVRMMTPSFISTAVSLTQDSFPLRCKGVHVVNQPFGFEAIYNLFKPFLSEKLRKRVKVYGTDWKSLQQHLPKEVLPHFYGGVQNGIDNTAWVQRLSSLEEAMRCS